MLDAGCGNGTLSAELAGEGIDVVALDFSGGAHRAFQYAVFNNRVSEAAVARLDYVQGDLQAPPFGDGEFDLIYADGVLHHTPDTRRTFMTLTSRVRPGGQFFVWLYRSDTRGFATVKRHVVHAVRAATGWMSYRSRLALCYVAAVPILAMVKLLQIFGWRARPMIPIRQKAINLFDTITPTYNHEHTPPEVIAWFREAGFENAREVTISDFRLGHGGFAVLGRRPANT
jgi:SAM-dependent methyltransferase